MALTSANAWLWRGGRTGEAPCEGDVMGLWMDCETGEIVDHFPVFFYAGNCQFYPSTDEKCPPEIK